MSQRPRDGDLIGALYFGREVFVPIALAILLSFVLAPLVRLLQRGTFRAAFPSSLLSCSHLSASSRLAA